MDDSGLLSFSPWDGYSSASRKDTKYQAIGAETVFKPQLGISTAGQGSSNLISYKFPYP
jgi:hypothetical protein